VWGPECTVQSAGFVDLCQGSRVRGAWYRVRGTGCVVVRGAWYRVRGASCTVQGAELRVGGAG
jgi:hypothetical protein